MLAAMFKEIVQNLDLGDLKTASLVLFVAIFAAVLFYALTRSKAQATRWAHIPLDDQPATREEPTHV
jgi:hypothetical protein